MPRVGWDVGMCIQEVSCTARGSTGWGSILESKLTVLSPIKMPNKGPMAMPGHSPPRYLVRF